MNYFAIAFFIACIVVILANDPTKGPEYQFDNENDVVIGYSIHED